MADVELERRLRAELSVLADDVEVSDGDELLDRVEQLVRRHRVRRRGAVAAVAVAAVVLLVAGAASVWEAMPRVWIEPADPAVTPTTGGNSAPTPQATVSDAVESTEPSRDGVLTVAVTGAEYFPGSPEFDGGLRTDFVSPIPGDDGGSPEPLGSVDVLPGSTRLQFLWDGCGLDWESGPDAIGCHRDAHFVGDDGLGSSSLGPGKPFHIRHGFPVVGPDPLGEGFDVAVYVTRSSEDLEDIETAWVPNQTVYFTADSTVRGQADRCGPQYREQSGPVECQWFVHEFSDGLPVGRYEIAVVWEAPCWAWVQYGLTDACDDPDASRSWFSSVVDSPWDAISTSFDAANHAGLSASEVVELVYGVDADRYSRWTATITGMTEAFNAGRLDDYLASFADDVTGPGDLVDPDMAAALMAASAAWTHELCLPGDGYGSVDVLTCWTTINDQFHPDTLAIKGDLTYSFDDEGRIVAIEPDRSEQVREDPITGPILQARRDHATTFQSWLEQTRPDTTAAMQRPWLANGMPHADDMSAALQHTQEFLDTLGGRPPPGSGGQDTTRTETSPGE